MFESKPIDVRIVDISIGGNMVRFQFQGYFQGASHPGADPLFDEPILVVVDLPSDGLRVKSIQSLAEMARAKAGLELAKLKYAGSF